MLKGYQLTCTCRWPAQARFPLLALQSATFHEGHLNLFARPWEPRFLRSCWNGSLAMLIPSGPYDRGWGSGLPSLSAWVSAKDPGALGHRVSWDSFGTHVFFMWDTGSLSKGAVVWQTNPKTLGRSLEAQVHSALINLVKRPLNLIYLIRAFKTANCSSEHHLITKGRCSIDCSCNVNLESRSLANSGPPWNVKDLRRPAFLWVRTPNIWLSRTPTLRTFWANPAQVGNQRQSVSCGGV